nr:hypothetical protein [Tanacetum cinerariifolium]
LISLNNLLVKSWIILDSILNDFKSFNDSIQSLEKISPISAIFVKTIHGCLDKLVSMFPFINILFIVSFNRGLEGKKSQRLIHQFLEDEMIQDVLSLVVETELLH